jgi:hypothetical protein
MAVLLSTELSNSQEKEIGLFVDAHLDESTGLRGGFPGLFAPLTAPLPWRACVPRCHATVGVR